MKYVVKYRKGKGDAFKNAGTIVKATRGRFKGSNVWRDSLFDTYEEAEVIRKKYALTYGEENTKIAERKA